jgi:hypothetical protein
MSTLNDHLRNLLDEVPGVSARDFLKSWNREVRSVCQERRWRDLRTQRQFQIGANTFQGTGITGLPYSTGTVAGTYATTSLTGAGGANFLGEWNGLNSLQILINGKDIYDVVSVNSATETLTVWPALRTTYTGNQYQIYWVSSAPLPTDMMGIRWIGKLSDSGRSELRLEQPRDYIMDRVVSGQPFIQMTDSTASGEYVVHYYRDPIAATGMGDTLDLPEYVQDLVYCRLLLRYIDRASMDQGIKSYMHAEAKDRIARAKKAAISYDETQERDEGINESTLWTRSQFRTLR